MTRWLTMLALLCCLFAVGCTGSTELGPADPSDTPQVSEEDIQKSMQQGYSQAGSGMEQYQNAGGGKK